MYRFTAFTAFVVLAVGAQAADYRITITDTGPQPLSPLFFSASDSSFDIINVGGTASAGIKRIAETGNAATELSIAAAAGSSVASYGLIGASPLTPGSTRTILFSTDAAHPYFSFAAMLGKTNDGFIGESVSSMGLNLFSGGKPQGFTVDVFGTRAWDAGTEKNTQNLIDLNTLGGTENPQEDPADAHIRVHGGIIPNVGDSWQLLPNWATSTQLAHIQVQAVPEPTTVVGLAMGGLALLRRRGRRN